MRLYTKRYSYAPYNDKVWNAAMHSNITRINSKYNGLRKRFLYCYDHSVSLSLARFPKNNIVTVYSIGIPLSEVKVFYDCDLRSAKGFYNVTLSFRKFNKYSFGLSCGLYNKFITIKRFTNFPLGYSNKINRILVDLEEYYTG